MEISELTQFWGTDFRVRNRFSPITPSFVNINKCINVYLKHQETNTGNLKFAIFSQKISGNPDMFILRFCNIYNSPKASDPSKHPTYIYKECLSYHMCGNFTNVAELREITPLSLF